MGFTSITDAANAANSGDTILVYGMTSSTGLPVAYSESNFFGFNGEVFPIVLRDGVTLKAAPGTSRVVIASSAGTPPSALVALSNTPASVNSSLTTIANLSLIGGSVGIRLDATSDAAVRHCLLKDLVFDSNGTAISCEAHETSSTTGAQIVASVEDCKLYDLAQPQQLANPGLQFLPQSIGIHVLAGDTTGAGHSLADIDIKNLQLSGAFNNMAAVTHPGGALLGRGPSYLEKNTLSSSSRLVEVITVQGAAEHSSTSSPTTNTARVDISGCNLQGFAASQAGWDFGVYQVAVSALGVSPADYHSISEVTVSGTQLQGFRETAVFAFADTKTRATMILSGGTEIHDSGQHIAPGAGSRPYRHSGIYAEAYEGYLGLVMKNVEIHGNRGNGILAFSDAVLLQDSVHDFGLYLGAVNANIHHNDANGLQFQQSDYYPGDIQVWRTQQASIVGGTLDKPSSGFSLIAEGDEVMFPVIPIGQGSLNRCLIHDNGNRGIYVRSQGMVNSYNEHSVSNRLENSYLWNNPGGGFFADLDPHDPNPASGFADLMPAMYFPILHCNLFHNGSASSDYSYEIEDIDGFGALNQGFFDWHENLNLPPLTDNHLATRLLSSIFDRDGTGTNDFGPLVDIALAPDAQTPRPGIHQIGVGGIRANQSGPLSIDMRFARSTTTTPPYLGGSAIPQTWFLDTQQQTFSDFDLTLPFLTTRIGNDLDFDILGDMRPTLLSGNRDKGGRQNP